MAERFFQDRFKTVAGFLYWALLGLSHAPFWLLHLLQEWAWKEWEKRMQRLSATYLEHSWNCCQSADDAGSGAGWAHSPVYVMSLCNPLTGPPFRRAYMLGAIVKDTKHMTTTRPIKKDTQHMTPTRSASQKSSTKKFSNYCRRWCSRMTRRPEIIPIPPTTHFQKNSVLLLELVSTNCC